MASQKSRENQDQAIRAAGKKTTNSFQEELAEPDIGEENLAYYAMGEVSFAP